MPSNNTKTHTLTTIEAISAATGRLSYFGNRPTYLRPEDDQKGDADRAALIREAFIRHYRRMEDAMGDLHTELQADLPHAAHESAFQICAHTHALMAELEHIARQRK